jgi:hypothetical protein
MMYAKPKPKARSINSGSHHLMKCLIALPIGCCSYRMSICPFVMLTLILGLPAVKTARRLLPFVYHHAVYERATYDLGKPYTAAHVTCILTISECLTRLALIFSHLDCLSFITDNPQISCLMFKPFIDDWLYIHFSTPNCTMSTI